MRRAWETADLLAAACGSFEVSTDCSLCEIHFGEADGLSWKERAERYCAFDIVSEPTRKFRSEWRMLG